MLNENVPPTTTAAEPAKKKRTTQPSERTLRHMRKTCGDMVGKVDRWLMHAKPFPRTVDFLGFIDIIAVDPVRLGVTGIQCTAASGLMARVHKVMDEIVPGKDGQPTDNALRARAIKWCQAGNRLLFHGWRKDAKKHWIVDERELVQQNDEWVVVRTET
jgi:hypothetical protein